MFKFFFKLRKQNREISKNKNQFDKFNLKQKTNESKWALHFMTDVFIPRRRRFVALTGHKKDTFWHQKLHKTIFQVQKVIFLKIEFWNVFFFCCRRIINNRKITLITHFSYLSSPFNSLSIQLMSSRCEKIFSVNRFFVQ